MNEGNPCLLWRAQCARLTPASPCPDQRAFQRGSSPPMEPVVACRSYCRLTSMERATDHIHLLLTSQPHEVDGISRDTNRQMRVLLRMIHRIQKRVTVQYIYVHVIARVAEKRIEHASQIGDAIIRTPPESLGEQRGSERDAIGCVAIWNLRNRSG